eukprot:CAMPEP_0194032018 /NCGR_PEP_ID=MMETSP0009_2-20130614/5061_1 /TAXON_ID=210454 /ORGANISM="Grammatophora oceanica, Strain CCMP 410" /LENGTH=50 /DNA_ID=CAMNT_0038672339 /DNA_START=123 /DNA_END=272 /DNA_ORIENTATION=-
MDDVAMSIVQSDVIQNDFAITYDLAEGIENSFSVEVIMVAAEALVRSETN